MRCLALIAGIALGLGCAPPPREPAGAIALDGLDRFYKVSERLYRSAQPSAADFEVMARDYRIKIVIKLNSVVLEHRDVLPAGVEPVEHPWLPAGPVSHEEVEATLDDIDACVSGSDSCLVHCTEGRDRTGLAVALWRVRHGSTPEAALGEWIAYGSHRFLGLEETFERETRGGRP